MSDAKTFECPKCGSALEPDGDAKEIKCAFCGSTVIVPDELRNHAQSSNAALKAQLLAVTQLHLKGVETKATILSVEDTHVKSLANSAMIFHFTLNVIDATTGEHFSSQSWWFFEQEDSILAKYQVGKEVIVRYNPAHKDLVAIFRPI